MPCLEPCDLRVPAVAVLREAEAGDEHLIARLEDGILGGFHDSGHVDSADDGLPPGDLAFTGRRQGVLVVEVRVAGRDNQLAFVEVGKADVDHPALGSLSLLVLLYTKGPEKLAASVDHRYAPSHHRDRWIGR